jgi:putative heme transporter
MTSVPEVRAGPRAWITRAVLLLLAAVITVAVVNLVGQIDWASVWDALGLLTWWQLVVLLSVLLVRQVTNAMPLALYIPGLSTYRATINDLAAHLMAVVAPPPSDVALRMAMFSSWGVPTAKALAGLVLNMLTFYIVRFATPLLGFALAAALGWAPGLRWLELLSVALAAAMVVTLHLVVGSQQLAVTLGTTAGRAVHRVRSSVEPDAWGDACQRFRSDVQDRYHSGFARGLLSQVGMIAADLTMLVLCLRFVGVDAGDVSFAEVAVAYLFAFPFTIFPFMGIGVVDALILAAVVEAGGLEVEAAAVAALIVWRVFTLAGPGVLGVFAMATWRSTTARAAAA